MRARSVSEVLGSVLEPVIKRRTGMTLDLLKAWPAIAGEEFAKTTKPEKINWPRRAHEDNPFQPATLVVACEPSAALFFQHEQAVIVERANVYFGFEAIKRVQIVQKPVIEGVKGKVDTEAPLPVSDEQRLQHMLDEIDDPNIKDTLAKLGRGIIASKED